MASTDIIKPDERAFNDKNSYYLAALASQAGPTSDNVDQIGSMMALRNASQTGSGNYLAALQAANTMAQQEAERDRQAKLAEATIANIAPQATAGVAGALTPNTGNYLSENVPALQTADATALSAKNATATKDKAEAVKNAAEAGFRPSTGYLGSVFTGPQSTTPTTVDPNFIDPGDKAKLADAAARQTEADAAAVKAAKYKPGGAQDGEVRMSIAMPAIPGLPAVPTFSGKNPAAVQSAAENYHAGHQLGGGNAGGGGGSVDPRIKQVLTQRGIQQFTPTGDGGASYVDPATRKIVTLKAH